MAFGWCLPSFGSSPGEIKSQWSGGGIVDFFFKTESVVTMPKGNKQRKRKGQEESPIDYDVTPLEDCKKFLVEFTARFYEDNTAMALESKYLRYKEESVEKFKRDMANNMLQALHVPR